MEVGHLVTFFLKHERANELVGSHRHSPKLPLLTQNSGWYFLATRRFNDKKMPPIFFPSLSVGDIICRVKKDEPHVSRNMG